MNNKKNLAIRQYAIAQVQHRDAASRWNPAANRFLNRLKQSITRLKRGNSTIVKAGNDNSNNVDNEPDLPDYSRGKLIHQKEVAALNLDSMEKIARKNSTSSNKGSEEFDIEKYPVQPDYAYKDQRRMSRRQLRNEMNTKSSYYHDMRLLSETNKEIGQLHMNQ